MDNPFYVESASYPFYINEETLTIPTIYTHNVLLALLNKEDPGIAIEKVLEFSKIVETSMIRDSGLEEIRNTRVAFIAWIQMLVPFNFASVLSLREYFPMPEGDRWGFTSLVQLPFWESVRDVPIDDRNYRSKSIDFITEKQRSSTDVFKYMLHFDKNFSPKRLTTLRSEFPESLLTFLGEMREYDVALRPVWVEPALEKILRCSKRAIVVLLSTCALEDCRELNTSLSKQFKQFMQQLSMMDIRKEGNRPAPRVPILNYVLPAFTPPVAVWDRRELSMLVNGEFLGRHRRPIHQAACSKMFTLANLPVPALASTHVTTYMDEALFLEVLSRIISSYRDGSRHSQILNKILRHIDMRKVVFDATRKQGFSLHPNSHHPVWNEFLANAREWINEAFGPE